MQYIQLQGQVATNLDTPLEGGFNLFIDTNDGTIKAKDSEGNISSTGGGGGLVETTYNQLTASLDSGSLTAGTYYKITDFKTCYDQPNYDFNGNAITTGNYKTGSLSPIIVFALDSGSLASDAYQPEYPNDNIKYDITFNQTEVTDSPAFGRIIYRKDNQGNEMDYDFREVRFKRYNTYYSEQVYDGTISVIETGSFAYITGSGTFFENFTTGSVVGVLNINNDPLVSYYEITSIENDYLMFITGSRYNFPSETRLLDARGLEGVSWKKNNIISDSGSVELPTFGNMSNCFNNKSTNTPAYTVWDEYTFLLPNNVFKGSSTYRDNSFSNDFRNNTFNDASSNSNIVMDRFYNNIINNDFDNNIIKDEFYDNIIVCDFRRNTVNGEFYNNHFGDDDSDDFDYNIINGEFYNNFYTAADDFYDNIINAGFYQNIILDEVSKNILNGFYNNVTEADFTDNRIGESFYGNKTYADFRENTIGDSVYNNNFFSTFLRNTLGGDVYNNNFYSYVEDNQIGSYFHSNDIGEPDDHGDTYFRRNKIDSWCYDNVILGNMQNNTIANYFYENTIGNNFQFNEIKTGLDDYDFTQYLGRINTVSFGETAATDGNYLSVTGSTNGNGVNAVFDITVASGLVSSVFIDGSGKLYQEGNTITIPSASFSGSGDLVLSVDSVSLIPEVYTNYNKTIQKAGDGTNVLTVILTGEGYYNYITSNITQAID